LHKAAFFVGAASANEPVLLRGRLRVIFLDKGKKERLQVEFQDDQDYNQSFVFMIRIT